MHHTYCVTRPAVWLSLLAVIASFFSSAGSAWAQQDAPGRGIVVPINATKSVPVASGKKAADIRIENPSIARVNVSADARSILITGLVAGATKLRVGDEDGSVEILDIIVQSDVEYLKYLMKRTVPTANVEPIPSANGRFIISGTVGKSDDIPLLLAAAGSVVGDGNIIPAVRVGGVMQVQLDVVIAQVSRTELRQMSFDFFITGNGNFFGSNISQGAQSLTAANALTVANAASALTGSSTALFGTVGATGSFFGFLDALRVEGLAKFLAKPKLVTMSGRPASFLSGGRLAIPEPSGLGTNAVRYEDFGTQLNFLPIVLGNGKIYLEVEPIVNLRDDANGTVIQGTAVPGFTTQRVQTSVEMEPGQTFAIGGLIQHQVNASIAKVPILGDIPFINTAFTNKSYEQREQELVILVTPHLVDPSTCDQLPKYLPGQETRIPDDFELFLEGIIEAPRGQRSVFVDWHYYAPYKNSPSASTYPCGARPYHDYVGPSASRQNGGCGPQGCGTQVYGGVGCQNCAQGGLPVETSTTPLPSTPEPMPFPSGSPQPTTLPTPTLGVPGVPSQTVPVSSTTTSEAPVGQMTLEQSQGVSINVPVPSEAQFGQPTGNPAR